MFQCFLGNNERKSGVFKRQIFRACTAIYCVVGENVHIEYWWMKACCSCAYIQSKLSCIKTRQAFIKRLYYLRRFVVVCIDRRNQTRSPINLGWWLFQQILSPGSYYRSDSIFGSFKIVHRLCQGIRPLDQDHNSIATMFNSVPAAWRICCDDGSPSDHGLEHSFWRAFPKAQHLPGISANYGEMDKHRISQPVVVHLFDCRASH